MASSLAGSSVGSVVDTEPTWFQHAFSVGATEDDNGDDGFELKSDDEQSVSSDNAYRDDGEVKQNQSEADQAFGSNEDNDSLPISNYGSGPSEDSHGHTTETTTGSGIEDQSSSSQNQSSSSNNRSSSSNNQSSSSSSNNQSSSSYNRSSNSFDDQNQMKLPSQYYQPTSALNASITPTVLENEQRAMSEMSQSENSMSTVARNTSIQSNLLGPGKESSPVVPREHLRSKLATVQDTSSSTPSAIDTVAVNDSEISSVTMDVNSNIAGKGKSKSFIGRAASSVMNKKKSSSFHQTGESGRRRRTMSLKLPRKSERGSTDANKVNPYGSRDSDDKKGSREGGGRDRQSSGRQRGRRRSHSKEDKRQRDRSRSIVKDAKSFIEEIEKSPSPSPRANRSAFGSHKASSPSPGVGGTSFGSSMTTEESASQHGSGASPKPIPRIPYLRNKHRDEETLKELQNRQRDLRESLHGSDDEEDSTVGIGDSGRSSGSGSVLLRQSEDTLQLLASLHETNQQNEATIQTLQEKLADLSNERNAFRNNSERMMEVMTSQKAELEKELKKERKGFADASHAHKKEVEELQRSKRRLEKRLKKLEVRGSQSDSGQDDSLRESASLATSSEPQVAALQTMNSQLKSQNREVRSKLRDLERRHENLLEEKDDEAAMVGALENKLEGCRIVIESMKRKADGESSSGRRGSTGSTGSSGSVGVNDELVMKIGDLADDNSRLVVQVQKLERDLKSAKRRSSASSAVAADGASMAAAKELGAKLEAAHRSSEDLRDEIRSLKEENRKLRQSFDNQDKTSRQMKTLVNHLRSSLTLDGADFSADDLSYNSGSSSRAGKKPIIEMEHAEALEMIEEMHSENDAMRRNMEETVHLVGDMKSKMADAVTRHAGTVEEYEMRLAALMEALDAQVVSKEEMNKEFDELERENKRLQSEVEEASSLALVSSVRDEIANEQQVTNGQWMREKEKLTERLDELSTENELLHDSMKEMNELVVSAEESINKLRTENATLRDATQYFEQEIQKIQSQNESEVSSERAANDCLRDEIEHISSERDESYETCKILQAEIEVLRTSVQESKDRVESLMGGDDQASRSSTRSEQDRLAELKRTNDRLTKDLEQKNEALQAVQSALSNFKKEQTTVRETIVSLRQENARLKEQQPSGVPPPPPKSGRRSSDSTDGAVTDLERRVKKIEKENKGLREANSTLSAKLFDEMEKTDALRVANEGLAARICKLVAFIQQGGEGKASTPSPGSGGGDRKKPAPPAPRRKR